jgi:hypothetical protein
VDDDAGFVCQRVLRTNLEEEHLADRLRVRPVPGRHRDQRQARGRCRQRIDVVEPDDLGQQILENPERRIATGSLEERLGDRAFVPDDLVLGTEVGHGRSESVPRGGCQLALHGGERVLERGRGAEHAEQRRASGGGAPSRGRFAQLTEMLGACLDERGELDLVLPPQRAEQLLVLLGVRGVGLADAGPRERIHPVEQPAGKRRPGLDGEGPRQERAIRRS